MSKYDANYVKAVEEYFGLYEEEKCSEEQAAEFLKTLEDGGELPEGYRQDYEDKYLFYKKLSENHDISYFEKMMFAKMAKEMRLTKKCVIFLTIVTAISLAINLLAFFSPYFK